MSATLQFFGNQCQQHHNFSEINVSTIAIFWKSMSAASQFFGNQCQQHHIFLEITVSSITIFWKSLSAASQFFWNHCQQHHIFLEINVSSITCPSHRTLFCTEAEATCPSGSSARAVCRVNVMTEMKGFCIRGGYWSHLYPPGLSHVPLQCTEAEATCPSGSPALRRVNVSITIFGKSMS